MNQQQNCFLLLLLLPSVFAATTLHFFKNENCNVRTAIDEYDSTTPLSTDSTCYITPPDTVAIYVDGIEDGCAVLAYHDDQCLQSMASVSLGMCYYEPNYRVASNVSIGSWQGLCGGDLVAYQSQVAATAASATTLDSNLSTTAADAASSSIDLSAMTTSAGNATSPTTTANSTGKVSATHSSSSSGVQSTMTSSAGRESVGLANAFLLSVIMGAAIVV